MSFLFLLAAIVTVMEVFVAVYLIKKHKMKLWQSLYSSLPVIVVVWIAAYMYS
ncbi:hypothetical protein GCM10008983_03770 [Lentibacillus halophilus]|uniref:Uncharacterized protein n=1 Tax=Lentibacillus halophilus TaxID=295065 RepID=A0ABN0Z2U7_9BACI